jgi:hypothetical protein
MSKKTSKPTESRLIVPDEVIMSRVYQFRDQKVMFDRELAELYGVETRVLKQAVRRNKDRFPDDFMFELTKEEFAEWRSQTVMSKEDRQGLRYPPFAFTEQGVAMLSSVLNSPQAILINIQIIRVFTKLRQMVLTHQSILVKLNELESRLTNQDKSIRQLFDYLRQFISNQEEPRRPIGFAVDRKKKQPFPRIRPLWS